MSDELDKVRDSLLPKIFNPFGQYSDQEIIQTRAFVVLAHAEFESFIEDRVKSCAESAVKLWVENGLMTLALVHFSVYLASELKENFKWKDTSTKFEAILGVFAGKVQNNHGVKNENLKNLLKPIGIDLTDISILAPELESFGASRGRFAHTSGGAQTTKAIDPSSQHDVVFKKILPELRALDILISQKCQPNQQAIYRPVWYERLLQWVTSKFS